MMLLLDVASAVSSISIALIAGGLAVVSLIARAGRTFDGRTWTAMHRAFDARIGPYMAGLLLVAIASTAVALVAGLQLAFSVGV
jgi:hypothetical protein